MYDIAIEAFPNLMMDDLDKKYANVIVKTLQNFFMTSNVISKTAFTL